MTASGAIKTGVMLAIASSLVACVMTQSPPPAIEAARFCVLAEPITWSQKDTPDTISQVKIHNAKWRSVCSEQPVAAR